MASMKPYPRIGQMYQTRAASSSIRCKLYDAPPWGGNYIRTLEVEEIFGPVLEWRDDNGYVSIRSEEGWVNIWVGRKNGISFAHCVGIDHRIAD